MAAEDCLTNANQEDEDAKAGETLQGIKSGLHGADCLKLRSARISQHPIPADDLPIVRLLPQTSTLYAAVMLASVTLAPVIKEFTMTETLKEKDPLHSRSLPARAVLGASLILSISNVTPPQHGPHSASDKAFWRFNLVIRHRHTPKRQRNGSYPFPACTRTGGGMIRVRRLSTTSSTPLFHRNRLKILIQRIDGAPDILEIEHAVI